MDEYQQARFEGAQIFRRAIQYIQSNDWHHNSMDILLTVSAGKRWPQPMAVHMFSSLSNALGHETLSQFDRRVTDSRLVIDLFTRVAEELESP